VKRRPPSIPPLGDASIARLERGLFAALDARPLDAPRARAGRRGFAVALVGVAAATALFVVREGLNAGRRGEALPARAAQISTTTSGSRISIAGATLDVAPHSAVSFGGRDGAVVVVLDHGTVTCDVAPRTKRAPFIVEAGETRVTVIGTRFSVQREGAHATVSVVHGLVEVADTNMTELVHAGERYRPGEPVTQEPLASVAAAAPDATPAVVPPPSRAPEAATAPFVAAIAPKPARPRARRLALVEGPPPIAPAPPSAEAEPATAEPASAEGAPATAAAAPAAQAPDAPKATAATPQRSVQVLFELAAQLEVRDPEAALRIYGELAGDPSQPAQGADGGWAASALFASARLEAERGQARHARELAESYLQRFPRGPNADDARTLLAAAR
jgi:hypothetical protein